MTSYRNKLKQDIVYQILLFCEVVQKITTAVIMYSLVTISFEDIVYGLVHMCVKNGPVIREHTY